MIRRALLALVHGWLDAPAEIYRQTTRAENAEAERDDALANVATSRLALAELRTEYNTLFAFTTAPIETAP